MIAELISGHPPLGTSGWRDVDRSSTHTVGILDTAVHGRPWRELLITPNLTEGSSRRHRYEQLR